ncbi:MAG: hypothetical protein DWQ01_19375 [Planctomycetota bacterium]|nr:MAG: hypothetical protein DWQ01_19375 [Planctomycetota bacterium]
MLLFLLGCLVGLLDPHGDPAATSELHPSDGPDADVRVLVEPERVRFQILLNLAFIEQFVDVAREAEDDIHPVEAPWVHEDLLAFFREANQVFLDGVAVVPLDGGYELLEPDLTLLPLFPRMGKKALVKMQLVLDYPAKSMPQQVRMIWGPYPPDLAIGDENYMPTLTIRAQLFAAGLTTPLEFTQEEPEVLWHNRGESAADFFLQVPETVPPPVWNLPMLSIFCAGLAAFAVFLIRGPAWRWIAVAGLLSTAFLARSVANVELSPSFLATELPTDQEAEAIFRPLHANLYRAFDYTAESDVYDALAASVDGPLLENLYEQIYRGLIQQEQGGAVSRVQAVRHIQVEVGSIGQLPEDGRPGFEVQCRWQVDGRVTHWGHSHDRTNEYLARYQVVQAEAGWRIGGSQMLESTTVSATPEGAAR